MPICFNNFPAEVIAYLIRTKSYIWLRHINNKIKNDIVLKKNAKKQKNVQYYTYDILIILRFYNLDLYIVINILVFNRNLILIISDYW